MRIYLKNNIAKQLDTDPQVALSTVFVSPFFEQGGSWTLPLTLKHTPRNDIFFNYAGRFYAAQSAQARRFEVTVEAQTLVLSGILTLQSASANGYEAGITFQDANYYSRFGALTLQDCMKGLYYTPFAANKPDLNSTDVIYKGNTDDDYKTIIDRRKDVLRVLNARLNADNQMTESVLDSEVNNFFIFPVKTKDKNIDLNDICNYSPDFSISTDEIGSQNRTTNLANDNSQNLQLSAQYLKGDNYGYGVTVFLRLKYVIEQVFAKIGYTVSFDFGTAAEQQALRRQANRATGKIESAPCFYAIAKYFDRLCVLNNTADSIMPGYIPYEALVPNTTVTDFLQTLFSEFGFAFFEDAPMHCTMRMMANVLSSEHTIFPATIKEDSIEVSFADPAGLKLQHKSVKPDGWNEDEDMEAFFTKYPAAPLLVRYNCTDSGRYYNIADYMVNSSAIDLPIRRRTGPRNPAGIGARDLDSFKQWEDPLINYNGLGGIPLPDGYPDEPEPIISGVGKLRYVNGWHTDAYRPAICSGLSSFDTWGNIRVCSEPGHLPLTAPDSFCYRPDQDLAEQELKSELTDCPVDVLLCHSKYAGGNVNYMPVPAPMMDGIRNVTCNVKVGSEEQKQSECPLAFCFYAGRYTSSCVHFTLVTNEDGTYSRGAAIGQSDQIRVPYGTRSYNIDKDYCKDPNTYEDEQNPYHSGYGAWRLNTRFAVEFFHKEYSELLEKGMHTITFETDLTYYQISNLRFDTIYYSGMYRFLIKQIESSLTENQLRQKTTITAYLI